ncbi:hypothetical protein A9Q87_07555 [Flavobacteriales bacterium 34_180_T64]|nr:hypothetical protein A9Q87_07555 [Flavobacteriales bacterium 34_180_T64]
MKISNHLNKGIIYYIILFLFSTSLVHSQEYILNNQNSQLTVSGTSSLHDWDIVAEAQNGTIEINYTSSNLEINTFKIVITSESLKSGKRGMDKNTYKALKTNEFENISFQLTETKSVLDLGNETFQVSASGTLNIAGATNLVTLNFKLSIKGNSINIIGEKSIKMTDYKIDPPKALLGTITTGDEIVIKFNTVLQK